MYGKMKDKKMVEYKDFAFFRKSFLIHIFQSIFAMSYVLLQAKLFSEMVSFTIMYDYEKLLRCSLLLFVITGAYFGISVLIKNRQDVVNEITCQKFCEKIIKSFFMQSKATVCQFSPGDVRKNIDLDAKKVADYYCAVLPTIVANSIFGLVTICLFVRKSLLLGIIFLALSILQVVPHAMVSCFSYKYYDDDREAQAKWSENIMSMYFGNAIIKIYGLHKLFFHKFQDLNKKWDKLGRKASAMGRISEGISSLIATILEVCSYLILGLFLLQNRINITAVTYLLVLAPRLFNYTNSVFAVFPKVVEYSKAAINIEKWKVRMCEDEKGVCYSKIVADSISIVHEGTTIIKDFSYEIDFSKKYFLVGDNGSGKTSLLEGLVGFQNIDSGNVLYDNCKINLFTKREFTNQFIYLPQEDAALDIMAYELFCQSNNCLKDKMVKVAKEFGLTQENIFSTPICDLSGGERKKVYLSLALSMDTKFLFLDEPTNCLDLESVDLLIKKIGRRKMGSLVVTHDTEMLRRMREFIIISI